MSQSQTAPDERQAPLIEPPRLRTGEERSASRLELFFDLAYILVLGELGRAFAEDLTGHGLLVFVGVLTVTWWSWVTTTLYANRFDTNDVIYRLAKLAMAAAVVGMAASAREVTGEGATKFAACYLVTRLLLLVLYARAWRHVPDARGTIMIYLAAGGLAAALWAASLPLDGLPRYLLWGAGILVEVAAPLVATRLGDNVPLHLQHLPDRFGLFVMLVLGEAIASLVAGLDHRHWAGDSLVSTVVAFGAVAALWWIYFDLGGAAGKRELVEEAEETEDDESGVADAYVYGHLPVVIGLSVAAVGIEQFIVHPVGELADLPRWLLHGGAAVFLLGVAVVMMGTSGRWRAAWPWPLVTVPFVAAAGFLGQPTIGIAAITVALVASVLAGMWAQRRGRIRTTET